MIIEHPDHPGVFYDPGLVSIRTGNPVADAVYIMKRAAATYSLPQTFIMGADQERQPNV